MIYIIITCMYWEHENGQKRWTGRVFMVWLFHMWLWCVHLDEGGPSSEILFACPRVLPGWSGLPLCDAESPAVWIWGGGINITPLLKDQLAVSRKNRESEPNNELNPNHTAVCVFGAFLAASVQQKSPEPTD